MPPGYPSTPLQLKPRHRRPGAFSLLVSYDLFRKPVSTFRDHALAQLASSPAVLRVVAISARAARAIRPLSLNNVTKRKPMAIMRAA